MEESRDKKAGGPRTREQFVTAYEKIAAMADESMAALRRKFAAPVRCVRYQDLVSTIWSVWQVRPDDITIGHIGDALDALLRNSEGGVALDRASCETSGIDYDQLIVLLQRARLDELSRGRKVTGMQTPGATTDPAASQSAQPPHPGQDTGAAGAPARRRKAGRPARIEEARKVAALAAREGTASWMDVAKILYDARYPTKQQVKNAPNILRHYTRTRVPSPDNI